MTDLTPDPAPKKAMKKDVIKIRLAQREDAASLRLLRLESLARNPEAFAADVDSSSADSAEKWAELLGGYAREANGVVSIASVEDRLIGLTGLVRGHWQKTRHSANIWGVYVNPEWRGLHVAEALVKECVSWAQTQGVVIVKLGVVTSNTPAIRCYARCGFVVYGIEPKSLYHDGVYYDELMMALSI